MAQKKSPELSSDLRRQAIEADVAAFLAAGNEIEEVPSGTSSQDPQGRGKQLRLGPPKTNEAEAVKAEPPAEPEAVKKS